MNSPKVLIIGGTGLISTGITKALLQRGCQVTHFNRGKTASRITPPAGGKPVINLCGDRNDFPAFEKTFANQTYDAVIDMICFNRPQAESAVRAFAGRTGHFIFTSSVCSYGNTQTIIPTPEGTPQQPHSGYGRDKVACEQTFLQAHAAGQLPVTIMRPSHTYGPGGSVIHNLGWDKFFIDRLRKGKPIIVSGDGHGLWQSTFCDDVGVGYAYAIGRRATFGEAYNIVGNEIFTWDQYTQATAHAIGAPAPRLVHVPSDFLLALNPGRYGALAEIFRYHGVYTNTKLQRDVPEFQPKTSYEDGVRQTVAWMDAHAQVENSDTDPTDDLIVEALQATLASLQRKLHEMAAR